MTPTRDIDAMLTAIDEFIARELTPLQEQHPQYFDHRREFARTDIERGGAPRREWDELLVEMMRRADSAGLYRFALPSELSPRGITAFLVPTDAPGFEVPYHHWTFNMPSDHSEVSLTDVRVPH